MTDPNVGFSIYISDRERERLEMERRKRETNLSKTSFPPPAPEPIREAPISMATLSSAPLESSEPPSDAESLNDEAPELTDEEIFALATKAPIVSVSNVCMDDTPYNAKHMESMAAYNRSICDNCNVCAGYEPKDKNSGTCAVCSCSLIHHLKSINMEQLPSDDESSDEEEWEDDDDDAGDGDDGNDDDDGLYQAESEEDDEQGHEESLEGDGGGEEPSSSQ